MASQRKVLASHRQLSGAVSNQHVKTRSFLSRNIHDIIELSRLYHPAPVLLIFFPHLYGLLYATIRLSITWQVLVLQSGVLFLGSIFFSNAAHIWNDIVDAPLDVLVPRTKSRPIPRGAVTRSHALVLCVSQGIPAAALFAYFPLEHSILYALPNIIATSYYPWCKRHSNFPQFVLGFCLAYGVFIGGLAGGMQPFSIIERRLIIQPGLLSLFMAVCFWTIIFDSVYARLDMASDIQLGIGSTAVKFQASMKPFLSVMLGGMAIALAMLGVFGGMGISYYGVAMGGALVSLGALVYNVDLEHDGSCWWWFGTGFWYTGNAILIGLAQEFLLTQI